MTTTASTTDPERDSMTTTTLEKALLESDRSQDAAAPASMAPVPAPSPPPDGGLHAWLQVFAGHLVVLNASGYTNTFGFFQSYETKLLRQSPSDISWVGSIQAFVILFVAAPAGRAADAGYFRHLAIAGATLQLLGIFMTSFAAEYWQFILAQGICQGLGSGLMLIPSMSVVATYFSKRRALAMGGVSSGAATGGAIFPLIARQLLESIGFGWTVRVFGFVALANNLIALSLLRPRNTPHKGGALVAFDALQDVWFGVFASAMFLMMLGLYFAYYYVTSFALDVLDAPSSTSLTMLLVINAAGIPGRFVFSYLSDHYLGPQNTLIIIVALTGMLDFVWAGVHSLSGFWGLVAMYGFVAANIQSLTAPALASAGRNPARIGAEMGMVFTIMSLGLLAGPPIAGALIASNDGRYLCAQMFAGSCILGGSLLFLVARVISHGWEWKRC